MATASKVQKYDPTKIRTFPLSIAMRDPGVKLLIAAMVEVGPASQTLGGILSMTLTGTFASANKIADRCRLPLKTVRKHLVTLQEHGWIQNDGREPTRTGRARRTCTIRITAKTKAELHNYCPLPWWVCAIPFGRQWSSRAVWAVIVRRWLELRNGIIETYCGEPYLEPQLPDHLDSVGGEERFGFSLNQLQAMTGLSRDSIVSAKRQIKTDRFIRWVAGSDMQSPDRLIPNFDMNIIVEELGNGRCRIHREEKKR